jgi:hypothetical protein
MDYFGYNSKKAEPKPKVVERVREIDPLPIYREPEMDVVEGNLSDTFIGRMKTFWKNR